MKKIRVTRDMPFAKVGEIFDPNELTKMIRSFNGNIMRREDCIHRMIRDGWIEFVKEDKSLEEKIINKYGKLSTEYFTDNFNDFIRNFSNIAKEHHIDIIKKRFNIKDDYFSLGEKQIINTIIKVMENDGREL